MTANASRLSSEAILSQHCDVFKAEFPGTLKHETDGQLQDNLHKLNEASKTPWVLLSAGVDFPDYKKQVEMAVKAGASGILGGRAFWKEYFLQDGFQGRDQFARGECVGRVKQIDDIVRAKGKPWYAHYGLTEEDLQSMRATEHWQYRYGGAGKGGTTGNAVAEGEVY